MRILTDQDIERVPRGILNDAIKAHIVADAEGVAASPPRHNVAMDRGAVTLAVGGGNGYAGFSAHENFNHAGNEHQDQVTAGWDTTNGKLLGLAIGDQLGNLRLDCIGSIAADTLASQKTKTLALIGSGQEARAQLTMAASTRQLENVRIFDAKPVAAAELAKQFGASSTANVTVSGSPEEAVKNADMVILATNNSQPAIDASWIAPGAYVTSCGPQSKGRHELPIGIAHRAKTICSDSPQQILADPDHFLHGESALKRMVHLGSLVGTFNPDRERGITLFLSSGVAGSDVAALKAAIGFLSAGQPVRAQAY